MVAPNKSQNINFDVNNTYQKFSFLLIHQEACSGSVSFLVIDAVLNNEDTAYLSLSASAIQQAMLQSK